MSATNPVHRAAEFFGQSCEREVFHGQWNPGCWTERFDAAHDMAVAILGEDDADRAVALGLRYARLLLGSPEADEQVHGPKEWRAKRAAMADLMRRSANGELAEGEFLTEYRRIYPREDE